MTAAYKRYALALMTAVYTVNLLDRAVVGLLLQNIKEDLQLSDTQLGFLTGIAFGLFYAVLGLPIARWADRGNRTTITSLAIGLWSLTVMIVPLVTNFAQMAMARMAAAVGESGCKPPTYSLVGDYFQEPAARTRAMSIYWMGGPLSLLIGLIAGGWLSEQYGWRMTFLLMGIPGVLLAILVKATLVEPRALAGNALPRDHCALPMKDALSVMWNQRSCRNVAIALILIFTMLFGVSPWKLVFMMRHHGMGSAELGAWWGALSGVGGIIGTLAGGYVTNRWFAGNERGQMRMSAVTIILATVFFVAFLLAPQKHLALIMLALWYLLLFFFVAPTYALLQRLVADEMRATAMAAIMLLYNLIGMGLGPQLVGLFSDGLAPVMGDESLRYALFITIVLSLWSAYHFLRVARTVEEDLALVAGARQRNNRSGGSQARASAPACKPAAGLSSLDG